MRSRELQLETRAEDHSSLHKMTEKEKELVTPEKESSNNLGGGVNEVMFVKLKDGGSGVFKTKFGECPNLRREIEAGTYYQRERAAHLVDRFLGFGLVPPTVIREIDGQIGSFQEFIPDAKSMCATKELPEAELMKLWVFDFIIYNSDRHRGNLLLDKEDKKVYAIDNGLAFGNALFYPYKEFLGKPIPGEIKEKLNDLYSSEDKKGILKDLLEELLPNSEVEALFGRLERIVEIINEDGCIKHYRRLAFEGKGAG